MSKLLPDRHPNRDFFIIDIADAKPKDDMASMEHPVFSLSVKPDMRELEYTSGQGNRIRIVPSGVGLATIMDKDILLFCISKLMAEKQAGNDITPWVEATAHEIMVATNWQTNDDSYRRFENAMLRLRGTTIITDVKTGGSVQSRGFGLIEEWDTVRKDASGNATPFGRQSKVRIKLSDWTFRAIQANEVLTIDRRYFRLRRPRERRLYEIARKHCGAQSIAIKFGIEKLQARVGSNAPLKKFRFNMKEIIPTATSPTMASRWSAISCTCSGSCRLLRRHQPGYRCCPTQWTAPRRLQSSFAFPWRRSSASGMSGQQAREKRSPPLTARSSHSASRRSDLSRRRDTLPPARPSTTLSVWRLTTGSAIPPPTAARAIA